MSAKSLAGRVAAMLAVAVLVGGCGSSSKSDSTSQPASSPPASTSTPSTSAPSTTSSTQSTPTTVNGAVDKCLAEAKKVSDASAQKTAVEACKAVKSGNAGALKAAAKKECLAVSAKVPNGPARQQAEAACNKATK